MRTIFDTSDAILDLFRTNGIDPEKVAGDGVSALELGDGRVRVTYYEVQEREDGNTILCDHGGNTHVVIHEESFIVDADAVKVEG